MDYFLIFIMGILLGLFLSKFILKKKKPIQHEVIRLWFISTGQLMRKAGLKEKK